MMGLGRIGLAGEAAAAGPNWPAQIATQAAAWLDVDGAGVDETSLFADIAPTLTGTGGGSISNATPYASTGGVVGTVLDRARMNGRTAQGFVDARAGDVLSDFHFASGIDGWSAVSAAISHETSAIRVVPSVDFGYATLTPAADIPAGITIVEVNVTELAGSANVYVNLRNGASNRAICRVTSTGVARFVFNLGHDANEILLQSTSNGDAITIDYLKIASVPGIHLFAPSNAARPTFKADGSSLVFGETHSVGATLVDGLYGTMFWRQVGGSLTTGVDVSGGSPYGVSGAGGGLELLSAVITSARIPESVANDHLARVWG